MGKNKKVIYRIENPITNNGMWYNHLGEYDPFILRLTDGKSKGLPMGYNELHKRDNRDWYSGTDSRDQLEDWFSLKDVNELMESGYYLYKFIVTEWNELEHEVLFTREGIISQTRLEMSDLWDV